MSLFSGKVDWKFSPNLVPRRSRLAFVFPGQGAMFPGMAQQFQTSSCFLSFCERADRYLKTHQLPLASEYLFHQRRLTLEQQEAVEGYALFTFEVAVSFLLIEAGFCPSAVTGHSFGEYAALVLSGALNFENGLECIFSRESVLPARNEAGYLLAVSLSEDEVSETLQGVEFFIAVKNTPDQTVLATDWWSLIQIEKKLQAHQVRFKRLTGPQPFHSPLLKLASHQLNLSKISDFSVSAPITPMFSSVTQQWINVDKNPEEAIRVILRGQLTEPVDFMKQVRAVAEVADEFIEVSPRSLLDSLIKKNAPEKKVTLALEVLPEAQEEGISRAADLSPSLLKRLNTIIARVTGYSIDDIRVEKKFQEDLGIDSIKTMELSIEVLSEFRIPREQVVFSRQVKTVGDLALMVQSRLEAGVVSHQEPILTEFHSYQEQWLPDPEKLSPIHFREERLQWIMWSPQSSWSKPLMRAEGSIWVIEITDENHKVSSESIEILTSFVEQIQSWIRSGEIHTDLSVVLIGKQENSPWLRGFSGFFKSLKKEGEIASFCQILVLDPALDQKALELESQRQVALGHHTQLRYSEGQRWIGSLEPVALSKGSEHSGGNAWVLGGAKGIAFELLKQLPKTTSWDLLLLGRASEAEVTDRLQTLKYQERHCRYATVDFTDPAKVEQLIHQEQIETQPLQLLVQSAGIQLSKRLRDKARSEIIEELSAKIETTRNCLQSLIISPQTSAILMSSIIARFGNHGQSIYALASGFAEALWHQHSWIQWPPWKKIGMTQSGMVSEVLEAAGVSLIEPEKAYIFWKHACDQGNTVVLGAGDAFLYQTPLLDFRALGVQVDQVIPQQRRIGIYFQLNDFLQKQCRDHAIKNQAVVPLAWMAQWFFCWGARFSSGNVRLRKLAVYRFLNAAPENPGLHCEVSQEALEPSKFNLVLKDAQGVIAEARVEQSEGSVEPLLPRGENQEVFYLAENLYAPDRLFHGPQFQFIKELKIQKSTGSARAEIHRPTWEVFQILDAALQTLGAYLLEVENLRGIPMGVESVTSYTNTPVQGMLFCELIQVEKVEGGAEGKLLVFNQNQEILWELVGAKFRIIDSEQY